MYQYKYAIWSVFVLMRSMIATHKKQYVQSMHIRSPNLYIWVVGNHTRDGRVDYFLTLPWINPGGSWFNERACHCTLAGTVVAVHFPQAFTAPCVLSVPVCPTVPEKRSCDPLKDTIWPWGEHALPEEMLRWLFHRFLANTVVFFPLALRQRTHRNAIWLSRYCSAILSQDTKSGKEGCSCTRLFIPGMNDQGWIKRIL